MNQLFNFGHKVKKKDLRKDRYFMGYIEELRNKLGNEPIILNSAGVIILDPEGKVLLQYRKDTNNWGLPGGYMELGETFEDTAKREIKEGMGIGLSNLAFLK